MNANVHDCMLLQLPRVVDSRGALSFVEGGKHVPFTIARLFYMYDFPRGTRRGGHAHRECHQFLIAQEGKFEVVLDDGTNRCAVVLERPDHGLHIPPGIWVELTSLSERAVITALASAPYIEADYLRSYSDFVQWKRQEPSRVQLAEGGVLIRPYQHSDAAAFSRSAQESANEVGRWLPWCGADYDEARAASYIRLVNQYSHRASEYSFGVFADDATGEHLGGVSLNRIEWPALSANLGYWMATRVAGRGLATIAARLMCRHAFETLGLERIQIQVELGNEGSRRVAEKLGAKLEGVARHKIRTPQGWADARIYGLLRADFC